MFQSMLYCGYVDQFGVFMIVYLESFYLGMCWDVSLDVILIRDGGVNSEVIVIMIRWVIENYGVNIEKVVMMGGFFGVMMMVSF